MTQQVVAFEEAFGDAVNLLRAAFVELYDSVNADPLSPQDVARRFGLNKTLTWNVSRLIQGPAGLAAVAHVPGKAAIEKMLQATQKDGASEHALARVRKAADVFERVIEVHVGDRATLDLVLDTTEGLERSRKLAFRGASGLHGVQAKTKLLTSFLAPNPDEPDRLDMAMIAGYHGFRRLRSSARWPLFKPRSWTSDEEPVGDQWWQPIESPNGHAGIEGLSLMKQFGSGPVPEMEAVESPDGVDIVLRPGPIGNSGAFACYRGDFLRSAAGRYRTDRDDTGEFGASITTPVEFLVADLIVHEDLDFALSPEVVVFGRLFPHGEPSGNEHDLFRLPIDERVTELPGSPPAVATPLVPHYAEMVRAVFERLEWDPARFRAVRLQMMYPPFGSTVLLRFALPEPPA